MRPVYSLPDTIVPVSALIIGLCVGCLDYTYMGGGETETGALDNGDDDDDANGDDDDDDPETPTGDATGTVCVELYSLDENGNQQAEDWDDHYDSFPFGHIFVGAFTDGGEGDLEARAWFGDTTINSPSMDCDEFELTIDATNDMDVYLMAQLDLGNDGVLGTWDPKGISSQPVSISEGSLTEDVEITILVDIASVGGSGGDGGWGGGGGGGGGGNSTCSVYSGPFTLSSNWDGLSMTVAMVYDTDGQGPYSIDNVTNMSGMPDGAEGEWELDVCASGEYNLLGAYDLNGNNLIDPADDWGAYVSSPDTNGNPLEVDNSTDVSGLEIQVPLGDGSQTDQGVSLIPFVYLTGTISVYGGVFDDFEPGTEMHVAALKYRPSSELSQSEMVADAYDYSSWTWAELTGETEKSFTLGVPAETTLYLWAYADIDADGSLNESGEYVASGGTDDNGTIETGTASSNHELQLAQPGN